MRTVTDSGWAWVVLAGAMGCNFLHGVLCYFVGVVHTGLLHRFQASVTTTAWVGALYAANMSLTAPIAAAVINRYGCRICCIVGGVLCSGGFMASAFVPSIAWLFVTYGLMAGLGLGLTYAASIITISYYFNKFRGLATGFAVAFAAIGILSGSLIAQTLIDQYSVGGAFMIISAITLHFVFLGGLFRPTEYELGGSTEISVEGDLAGILENRASRLSLALHGIAIRAVSQHSIHKDQMEAVGRTGYGSVTSLLRKAQLNVRRQNLENVSLTAVPFPSKEMLAATLASVTKCRLEEGLGGSCPIVLPDGDNIVQVKCEEIVDDEKPEMTRFSESPDCKNMIGDGDCAVIGDNDHVTSNHASIGDGSHATTAGGQIDGGGILPTANGTATTTPLLQSPPEILVEHVHQNLDSDLNHHHHKVPPETASDSDHYHHPHHHPNANHTSLLLHTEEDSARTHHNHYTPHHNHHHHHHHHLHHHHPHRFPPASAAQLSPCSDDTRSLTSSRGDDEHQQRFSPQGRRRRVSPSLLTKLLKTADSYMAVLSHKGFMCHCIGILAANVHVSGVYLHLPDYVVAQGTSTTQAAALFVAVGLFSLLSRLSTGFATMDPKIESLTLNIGMMGLCGLATIFFPFYSGTYIGQLVFSSLFGLYTGGLYALVNVIIVQFMGVSLLPTALGVLAFFMGVGYIVGPPLAALIVDNGGTFQHSFIFLGSMMLMGAFLDMAAVFFTERESSKEEEEDPEKAEEEVEVASISRDWLGSTIVISCQDAGSSAHAHCGDLGSAMSVRSRCSQNANT